MRNGVDLLPAQLAALSRQDFQNGWEIVVVDNGSTDGTARVARAWEDRLPMRVVEALDKLGASYARNVGVRSARGDLIAFCDADDEVSEGWLGAIVEASLESDAVGGVNDVTKLNDPVTLSWNSTTLNSPSRFARGFPPDVAGFLPAVGSGNLAVWVDVLVALDGFNDEYMYTAEDVDFSWRLQLAGYRLGFSQQALIHIRTRTELRALARQFYRYGRDTPQLYRNFRSAGMPRSSLRAALRSWAWLIVHLPDLVRDRSRRGNWVRGAAMRTGKVVGSIENRTIYL